MTMILEGIRVIDMGHWLVGPGATAMLGDLGAEVIKIEDRVTGDASRGMMQAQGATCGVSGQNWFFEHCNRNKKSVTVDLGKAEGRRILYELVAKSDVVVHNKRQSVMQQLKADYGVLSKHNPLLIYATASSFGSEGLDKDRTAMDLSGQARSGLMYVFGEPSMPPLAARGAPADRMGAVMTAFAIVAALLYRERTGIGQEVQTSMFGSMIHLLSMYVDFQSMLGEPMTRRDRNNCGNPLWNYYKCKDDKWIMLSGVQADRYWADLCHALGLEHIQNDPRFENMVVRGRNAAECIAIMDETFATKTRAEWLQNLGSAGDLIYESVNTIPEMMQDPQVRANRYIVDFDHPVWGKMTQAGFPMHFTRSPASIRLPAPEFGAHTEEVLTEVLGYTWEDIVKLKDDQVI
ncbi:MAG: CoA transferase [Dehalococcoidia bacterium]|nr:CoA transferase [Dehalococcoidia bacterium]